MNAIAIDFETANEERGSACAMGLAWIERGVVVKAVERLIRPKDMRFAGLNVAIHGITPEDVKGQPEFPRVLEEFLPEIEGSLLLAHNAAFDMSVLRATLASYNLAFPEFTYLCTAKIARQVWQNLITASLSEVTRYLGIKFEHHRAAADAFACATVAIKAAEQLGISDISEIPSHIRLMPGQMQAHGYLPCSTAHNAIKPSSVAPTTSAWDPGHPLYNRCVVFTGGLALMTRLEAAQLVVNVGGHVHDGVRKGTNFVVVAEGDHECAIRTGQMSSKLRKAKSMMAAGVDIEILTENDFYRLL